MIILDESHNFNDPKSKRSQELIQFCKDTQSKHTIFCSGTAIKALGFEMIMLLYCIDPFFNQDAEERFRKIYGVSVKRATDILKNRMDLISHKIPKTSVMKIEPPIIHRIRVKIPDGTKYLVKQVQKDMQSFIRQRSEYYRENWTEYETAYDDGIRFYKQTLRTSVERDAFELYLEYVAIIKKSYDPVEHKELTKYCNEFEKNKIIPVLPSHMKDKFRNARSAIKYLKLKILGEAIGNVLTKKRSECHSDMVRNFNLAEVIRNADKKTVCFSSFIDVIKTAGDILIKEGFSPVFVYGEHTKNIADIIDTFKKEPDVNPIIASIQSMSVGVTLIEANTLILFDIPYRHYMWEQAVHRIHRIGQDCQCYIYELTLDTGSESNISTRAEDIMQWSKEMVESILGQSVEEPEKQQIVSRVTDVNFMLKGRDYFAQAFAKFFN